MFGGLIVRPFAQGTIHVRLNYGESPAEADPDLSFLSSRDLVVPRETDNARGPLTGFRYVQVQFLDSPIDVRLLSGEQFLNPVSIVNRYVSRDPELIRIWEISAYTAQLSMQTEFFDGIKRDRNPFAGDLFVAGRAARAVFGHATDAMVKDTLADLLNRVCGIKAIPVYGRDINCIPGYNAWWIVSLSDLYQYTGDLDYLASQHDNLMGVITVMEDELNAGLFYDQDPGAFIFADWAAGMFQYYGQNEPEAVKITTMAYYLAFRQAAYLLRKMGDDGTELDQIADQIKTAAVSAYFEPLTGTFGRRVQTNAMAIFSGVADPGTYDAIFAKVLNRPPQAGTPYFYYFVLEAMETSGHHAEAIHLIKDEWGGMLSAGATSVWEIWDPRCAGRHDAHECVVEFLNSLSLYPANRLYVSLAHSWSAGPAAFLAEH